MSSLHSNQTRSSFVASRGMYHIGSLGDGLLARQAIFPLQRWGGESQKSVYNCRSLKEPMCQWPHKIEIVFMGGRNKTQNEGQSEVLVFGVILVCRTTVIEFFQSDRSWERVWPKVSVCQATFSPCICLIHKNSVFHDLHDKIKKYIHIYTQLSYYPLRIEHCFTEIKFCNLYIYIYIYIYIS